VLMLSRSFAFLFLSGASALAFSAPSVTIPNELMYRGKPIDSLCFAEIPESNLIDLRKCGAEKSNYVVKEGYEKLMNEGFMGYAWLDSDMPSGPQGSTYYRFYPAGKSAFWIYAINNGGGSGVFTSILQIERRDVNTLAVKLIDGGDRCNGGLENVSVNNDIMSYSVNLTAFDVIALDNSDIKLKAYEDLASCAVCCVAKAQYSLNADDKPVFEGIKFEKYASINEMPEQGSLQGCFNKLSFEYINKNDMALNQDQLHELVGKFTKLCTKP